MNVGKIQNTNNIGFGAKRVNLGKPPKDYEQLLHQSGATITTAGATRVVSGNGVCLALGRNEGPKEAYIKYRKKLDAITASKRNAAIRAAANEVY